MTFHPKKTKFIVVRLSRTRTIAPGYGDLTLGGAELKQVKCLCILVVTIDSELTFDTRL